MKHDLTGRKFGRWTVIGLSHRKPPHYFWSCVCDCGTQRIVQGQSLGVRSFSCGCLRKEIVKTVNTTHGFSKTKISFVWRQMLQRCNNPKAKVYPYYGGRGIKVCKRWNKFENFLEDMLPTYREGLSLDRRNNDGNYSPSNCRWATKQDQARNRRSTVYVETPIGRLPLGVAAEKLNVSRYLVKKRFYSRPVGNGC